MRAVKLWEAGGTLMQICGQHEFLRSSAFGRGSLGLAQHVEQPSKASQGKDDPSGVGLRFGSGFGQT